MPGQRQAASAVTRRPRRRDLLRLAGGALLVATACRPAPAPLPTVAPPTPSPTPAARLAVGAIVELGADGQGAGLGRWQGALLGVEMTNADGGVLLPTGSRIELELVAYDANGRPESVATAMHRLAWADAALAIVVDGRADVADVVRRQAEQLATPATLLDDRQAASADPARWTYLLGTTDVDAVTALVPFLGAHGGERVGWIAPRTATADAVRDALRGEAARTTVRVVAEESYAAGSEPAPEALARLAFAGSQAIVGWAGTVAEAATLVRVAAERARGTSLYLGPIAATPGFLSRVGPEATGVRMIGPRLAILDHLWDDDPLTAPTRQFSSAFRQRFGATPTVQAATAWDAVRLLAAAGQRSGADRLALRDAIERTEGFNGASGPIDFSRARPNGLDARAFVVMRAEQGAWVLPP